MRYRRGAAFTLAILALALGAAACGGSGSSAKSKRTEAQARAAALRWRAGLLRWHHSMQQALDGISVIFSSQASLSTLMVRHSKTTLRLETYEATLANCSGSLDRIGPAPARFSLSGRYAVKACASLEQGERLVEHAVVLYRHNASVDPLDPLGSASDPLGVGQSELATAARALNQPT